ncbi:UNVERIFIED_CONTAM: hypothetical protein FKN15_037781, partial [Acipenser sinensis]
QKYKEYEKSVLVEEIDGLRLVKKLAKDMEEMFHKKAEAMRRLVEAAEEAHLQHEDDPELQYEYFNAVLINEVDQEGNSVELGQEFILQPNDHFNDLSVNISLSVVQVPTNMYNKGPSRDGTIGEDTIRASLISAVSDKLRWRMKEEMDRAQAELNALKRTEEDLKTGHQKLEQMVSRLDQEVTEVDRNIDLLKKKDEELSSALEKMTSQSENNDIDDVIVPTAPLYKQILNLYAEENAIEDTIFYLGEALRRGVIDLEVFLKRHCSHALYAFLISPLDTTVTLCLCRDTVVMHCIKWKPDEHGVIAFDCRNRKWYIQAATSPKDVIILVDVSGSMKGLRLTIARQTVSSILDTLGDDDFFNIIAYNEELHYVEPCLNGTLVQADRTNKDHFREHLDKLFAKGIGMLNIALTEAFTLLNDVRIFAYLIGRETAFADNLKWMACANKVIRIKKSICLACYERLFEQKDEYLILNSANDIISSRYEAQRKRNKGILLGVVGTDVPVQELLKTIPKYKLGIHGYAFAITNNGYILTHPDLRPLLRNAMVNRVTGTFDMEVKKTVDKGRNKGILLGVVGTDVPVQELLKTIPKYKLGIHGYAFAITNNGYILTHPDLRPLVIRMLFFNIRDKELIQEVLFDAVVTAPLEAYWTSLALNKSENSDKGVEIAFLGTRTGLSRINLFVVSEQLTNQDFLTAEDKEGVFNADHFPLWYKRAAEQIPGTFIYSLPFSSGTENKSVVLASTAIQLSDDRKSPIVAAVGIQMKLDFFQRKFWTASRQNISCYLIDNNGFILVSEDFSQPYFAFFAAVKWILTELVIFLVEFNLYSWWYSDLTVKAQRAMLVPCDTEYPAFVSERTIKETTGSVHCGDCTNTGSLDLAM